MDLVYEYLTYDGKSSEDYKIHISGSGVYDSPSRDIESISVPGRNGNLHIDNGRFNNVTITYPAFCTKDFAQNYEGFKAFLLSKRGYKKLADSYHPDRYRMAVYNDQLAPKMATRNKAGSFDISFDCDPRMFLKSGDQVVTCTSGKQLLNPTLYASKPLIRVYGTGTITISSVSVVVSSASVYTDLDCELMEAYKGTTNCNGNITLSNGVFPELQPGLNTITFTGFTKVEITPKWWTI